jgi:glycerol-3-phosphate acyltransferase PlsY
MDIAQGGLALLLTYLLGALPSAYLFTRWITREDIRALGSRNAGAANVFRVVSRPAGMLVFLLDAGKGAAGVMLIRAARLGGWWPLAGGVAAVLGHCFPVYLRFRGGRGLAASLGALLALMPVETAIILPLFGMIYVVLTGSAVTSAIASFICLVGVAWRRGQPLSHILAPFVLLLAMGVRVIPLGLCAWRRAEDKKRLMKRHLLRVRRTPDGRMEE